MFAIRPDHIRCRAPVARASQIHGSPGHHAGRGLLGPGQITCRFARQKAKTTCAAGSRSSGCRDPEANVSMRPSPHGVPQPAGAIPSASLAITRSPGPRSIRAVSEESHIVPLAYASQSGALVVNRARALCSGLPHRSALPVIGRSPLPPPSAPRTAAASLRALHVGAKPLISALSNAPDVVKHNKSVLGEIVSRRLLYRRSLARSALCPLAASRAVL